MAQLKCGSVNLANDAVDWSLYKSCRGGSNNGDDCSDADVGGDGESVCDPGGGTCEPDIIHVYHEMIVPGVEYHIELIDDTCDPGNPDSYSDPLILPVQKYGDIIGAQLPTNFAPPNNVVNIKDVLGVIFAIRNLSNAPIKARVDMVGSGTNANTLNGIINISDVLAIITAIRVLPYPYAPPAPCGP